MTAMRILGCVVAIVSCCIAGSSAAQQYPSKPVRMVVAAPPGGLTDIVARSVSQFLHEKLGQPFVVENVSGASSTIGSAQVMRSAPDGYTLLVNPSLFVITPMLMNVSYDVVKDFTPISNFGTVPIATGTVPKFETGVKSFSTSYGVFISIGVMTNSDGLTSSV